MFISADSFLMRCASVRPREPCESCVFWVQLESVATVVGTECHGCLFIGQDVLR